MTTFFSNLGQKPWFVPLLLIIMVLIALSSLLGSGESAAEEPEADMVASQLEALCNSVRGVKNAKVMITYESVPAASLSGFGSSASSGKLVSSAWRYFATAETILRCSLNCIS